MMRRRFAVPFLIAACVAAVALTLAIIIGPRVAFYLERAQFHAREERVHRSKLEEIRRSGESDEGDSEYAEWEHSTLATAHSRQKERYREAARYFWKQAPSDLAISYPWDQDRDRQVIETAVVEWMDRPTDAADRRDGGRSDWRIVIDQSTSIEPWEQIGSAATLVENGFPGSLMSAVERRNAAPESLERFKFSDSRIVTDDLMKLWAQDVSPIVSDSVWIAITLPAYSSDGKLAILAVAGRSSNHPTGALHGLEYTEGRWHLRWTDSYAGE
jgi:hypothetical protein